MLRLVLELDGEVVERHRVGATGLGVLAAPRLRAVGGALEHDDLHVLGARVDDLQERLHAERRRVRVREA